jgi:transcriptional regulator GlxA family with amidase domain
MRTLAFIIPPNVELLDLAGPVQVFSEAKSYGLDAEIRFYSYGDDPTSTSGLGFDKVGNYKDTLLKEGDYVFVRGMNWEYLNSISFRAERSFFK